PDPEVRTAKTPETPPEPGVRIGLSPRRRGVTLRTRGFRWRLRRLGGSLSGEDLHLHRPSMRSMLTKRSTSIWVGVGHETATRTSAARISHRYTDTPSRVRFGSRSPKALASTTRWPEKPSS